MMYSDRPPGHLALGYAGLYPARAVKRGCKNVQILGFLGFKKPENFTDLKVSKFFLLLSCNFLIKVTFKLYCRNRVSDLPTFKPKKPLKTKKPKT